MSPRPNQIGRRARVTAWDLGDLKYCAIAVLATGAGRPKKAPGGVGDQVARIMPVSTIEAD